MSDTSLRYLSMLQFIPRYPRNISTLELQQKLSDDGFNINLRSIQRDLEKLSVSFPLTCDESTRPFKWSFASDSSVSFLPALDTQSAITLELAKAYLKPLLPPKVLAHLEPHFKKAEDVLRRNGNPISHWPEKIRLISRGFIGERPKVNSEHLEDLAEAILTQQKCQVTYQARNRIEAEELIIYPLGLIYRDPNTYLLAEIDGRDDVRQLALHRFSSVTRMTESFNKSFDIDEFIAAGEMHVLQSKDEIKLEAVCKKPMMSHLLETPLNESQIITKESDHDFTIEISLKDSLDLRWWLIAQSANVAILSPQWLKAEIIKILKDGISNQGVT